MEINKHLPFRYEKEPELVKYLLKNNIKFNMGEICSLDIYESNPHWKFIGEYVNKHKKNCISETIFNKEELENAEWLQVRSTWNFEYPQPENNSLYTTITYTPGNYCRECGCGLQQVHPFRVKKAPKWSTKHFLMLNWVGDELFVDETAKNLLEKEFPFLSFSLVENKNGTEQFDNFYQIVIPVLSKEGIVEKQKCIREILVCSKCGQKKYHLNSEGMLQLSKKIFDGAPDMVKSAEYFGWGCGADRIIIISQKMYRFIVSNKLERGLEFYPINHTG